MSDTYRDVLGLRVVRRFLDRPVPADEVAALLEAARWTGSSKNRQDWAFVVLDIGRAAQNIMLAAAARGLGSCPVTLHDEPAARSALGFPDDHECRWVIALGYPDTEAEDAQRAERRRAGMSGRRPLAELAHWGNWGAQG
jgi:nitroreductase